MPVCNVERFIHDAIESIVRQTYKNFEFIIVDDCSTDSTVAVIRDCQKRDKRIVLVRNTKNIGVTKSLNKALKRAKGKYIVRMDGDDWSYPDRIERQIKLMEDHPDVVVSGSFIEVCDSQLRPKYIRRYHRDDASIRKHIFRYSPFAHPATIWQTKIVKRELYDERISICQDYELYFRVGTIGKFMNISTVLLKLRMHDQSVSVRKNDLQLKSTILIRLNAMFLQGYNMSKLDKLYNFLQEVGIGLLPVKVRFLLFNYLRRFNFY